MELAVANITDIDAIMTLHKKYHVHSIKEDDKTDGFVTYRALASPHLLTTIDYLIYIQ